MLNINFVPDDYIQTNESRRTNLMYLVLFVLVMAGLGGSFVAIRIRHNTLNAKEKLVNDKIAQAQKALNQFEELQAKRKAMIKTALTTTELLEPVPRSVLLASITNNMPAGVSLLRLNLIQKIAKIANNPETRGKYQASQAKRPADQMEISPEKLLETHIDIEGIAPSDLQVATYIERLSSSILLDNVALVESKEYKARTDYQSQSGATGDQSATYRQFRLTAALKKDVHVNKENIREIANNVPVNHRF